MNQLTKLGHIRTSRHTIHHHYHSFFQENHYQPPDEEECLDCNCYLIGSFGSKCDSLTGKSD